MTNGQYFVYGTGGGYLLLLVLWNVVRRVVKYREPDNYLQALRRIYNEQA